MLPTTNYIEQNLFTQTRFEEQRHGDRTTNKEYRSTRFLTNKVQEIHLKKPSKGH
jgi:hypothetical protein